MMRNDINIALVAMTAENSTQLTGIYQTNENATLSSALASAVSLFFNPHCTFAGKVVVSKHVRQRNACQSPYIYV